MVPVPGEGPLPPPVSRERPGVGKEREGGERDSITFRQVEDNFAQ